MTVILRIDCNGVVREPMLRAQTRPFIASSVTPRVDTLSQEYYALDIPDGLN